MLVGLELAARIVQTFHSNVQQIAVDADRDDRRWSSFSPVIGWALRSGFRGVVGGYPRAFDEHGHLAIDSRQIADTTGRTVLFVGDSNTFGIGTPTEHTFVEAAERRSGLWAAINLGVPGYSSWQGRRVLDDALSAMAPEAVVMSFGLNDTKLASPALGPDGEAMATTLVRLHRGPLLIVRDCVQYSAIVHLLTRSLQRLHLLQRPAPPRVDQAPRRVDIDRFRENLRAMTMAVKRHGARPVFLLLAANPIDKAALEDAIALLDSGRVDQAAAYLEFVAHEEGVYADAARLHLARAYRHLGRAAAADSVLVSDERVTSIFGGRPMTRDLEYNDVMRQLGADLGVAVVDAGPALLPHPEDFVDYCHFNAAAHERVGALVAATLDAILQPASRPLAAK